jgi:hypothetical protein
VRNLPTIEKLWKTTYQFGFTAEITLASACYTRGEEENIFVTSADIAILVEKAKRITMSPSEREQQRRSFAYGNANIENEAVTKDVIEEVAEKMGQNPGIDDMTSE